MLDAPRNLKDLEDKMKLGAGIGTLISTLLLSHDIKETGSSNTGKELWGLKEAELLSRPVQLQGGTLKARVT